MFESAIPLAHSLLHQYLIAYTMNPVPIRDTIVPTPNNAMYQLGPKHWICKLTSEGSCESYKEHDGSQ